MKYPETAKAARREVWRSIYEKAGAGAAVAIMERGEMVYSEGFGVADREEGRLVDSATRFDVASVSKMFTTVAALKLLDMGLLDIDRPYCEYVDDFVMDDERYREITVRMLFNHSSGLPGSCYNRIFGILLYNEYPQHVLDSLKRAKLKHAPGEKSTYCNDGFTLAQILIERISGRDFLDFIREHILEPLGLKDTGTSVGAAGAVSVAELYHDDGSKAMREVSSGLGTGGLSSTAEDLCRFGQSFCANSATRILTPESLRLLMKPQLSRFCDKLRTRQEDCHMGWDVNIVDKYESRGIRLLMKGGLTWYATKFIVLPEMDISMAVTFSGGGPSEAAALAILDALLEEKGLGSFKSPVKRLPDPQPIPPELREYAGFYANGSMAVQVSFDAEHVTIKPIAGEELPVKMTYADSYFYKKDELPAIPHYFAKSGGMCFFVAENELSASLVYQKIPYINEPMTLDCDIHDKTWLLVNMLLPQTNWTGMFVVKSRLCDALPGYIDFAGIKRVENGRFARTAGSYFRDQKDLIIRYEDGIPTAYCADFVLKSESIAAPLPPGDTAITVPDGEHNAVWHKTDASALMRVQTDPGVVVQVFSPDGKKAPFNSFVNKGEFFAPKGSYLVVYGDAGGMARISSW